MHCEAVFYMRRLCLCILHSPLTAPNVSAGSMTQPREVTVKIRNRLLIMFNSIAAGTQARYFKLVKSLGSADPAPSVRKTVSAYERVLALTH